MKMEKLFTMISGVYIRDMNAVASEFVQDQIQEASIPPSQVELVLDHLFLSWIAIERTMIIDMLNSAMSLIITWKDNDELKA